MALKNEPEREAELPKSLVIGGISYVITEHDEASMQDGLLMGDITYSKARIRIGDFMVPEKKIQVLFHELIHGLIVESDIERTFGPEGEEKEEKIQALSKVLLRFVQDNDLSRFRKPV